MSGGLVGMAVLGCYALGLAGWHSYRHAGPEMVFRKGLVVEQEHERTPVLDRFAGWCADRFAASVLHRLGPDRVAAIRRNLESAGRPHGMTLESYVGRKIALTVVFAVLGAVFVVQGFVWTGVLLVVYGWFVVDLGLRGAARRRQRAIERDLPDFLDILAVSVRAGLSFRAAIARVAEALPGPLAEEMLTALRKMELGENRRNAMLGLRERNGSEMLARFVASLLQAEELGTPLADTMRQIAGEMRRDAAARARQRAAKAAPRVSLVVTLVILPAAMLVMIMGLAVTTDFNLELFNG